MDRRDALLLGSIWNHKKVPLCCPDVLAEVVVEDSSTVNLDGNGTISNPINAQVIISPNVGNILINSSGLYVPSSITTQYHGNTALVSKSGNDATAATAFTTIGGFRCWDWNFPFLTLAAAHTAGIEPFTIKLEDGIYTTLNVTKSLTLDASKGVTINNIAAITTNKIFNIIGKPNLNPSNNNPALWIDNGTTGSFNLGSVIGDSGVFFRGRTGQTSYLNADAIIIDQDDAFLNGAIHNGAISHGATLYANVDFVQMTWIAGPIPNETVAVEGRGPASVTYLTSKIIRSNCGGSTGGDGVFHGTIDCTEASKIHIKTSLLENFGAGRAFSLQDGCNLYLDCEEIRVASTTMPAGTITGSNTGSGNLYFKSGCRIIAGVSSTYAITAVAFGGNISIDGTVYSNKPLDPAIILKSGTWVVDPDIV